MKRTAVTLLAAAFLAVTAAPLAAQPDAYQDSESHPLRIVAYVLHPIGYVAEWLLFRPFHYVVSHAGPVFGHDLHGRKPSEE